MDEQFYKSSYHLSKMGFWTTFGKAWKDYRANFSTIVFLMGLFVVIPALVYSLISARVIGSGTFDFFPVLLLILVFFVYVLTASFAYFSFIAVSLKLDRFRINKALTFGKTVYLRSLGYWTVLFLFLAGLFILLIVPFVIFLVYWAFGIYVFLEKRTGILAALKESKRLVRGRWWRTLAAVSFVSVLAFASLIPLFLVMVLFVFVLPETLSNFVNGAFFQIWNSILIMPLSILFFKHLYIEYKKRK